MTDDELNRAIAEKLEPLDAKSWKRLDDSPKELWRQLAEDYWDHPYFHSDPATFVVLWRALHTAGFYCAVHQCDQFTGGPNGTPLPDPKCEAQVVNDKSYGSGIGANPMVALRNAAAQALGVAE